MDELWLDALLGPEEEPDALLEQAMTIDGMWSQYVQEFDQNQAQQALTYAQPSAALAYPPVQPVVATGLQAASTLTAATAHAPYPITTGVPGLQNQASSGAAGVKVASRPVLLTSTTGSVQDRAVSAGRDVNTTELNRSTSSERSPIEDTFLGTKEKNKRAQKRFRERQKARLHDSEAKVADYSSRLASVESEKAQLENRVLLLEKIVQMKMDAPTDAASNTNLLLANGNEQCCQRFLIKMANEDKSLGKPSTTASSPNNPMVVLHLANSEIALTPEGAKQMTWPELSRIWKEYVNKVALLLVSANKSLDNQAGEQLKETVKESYMLCACISLMNPRLLRTFQAKRVDGESGEISDSDDPQLWQKVTKGLDLQPSQQKELMDLRTFYLTKLGEQLKERLRTRARMQGSMPQATSQVPLAEDYLQVMESVDEFNKSLREEHLLMVQLCSTVWGKILTPLQVANFMVQAYPRSPDTLAIMDCLAAGTSEVPTAELLGLGSMELGAHTSGSGC